MDLPYILTNLASLTGMPVRRMEDGILSQKRYSVVPFPFDPFSFHLNEVKKSDSHVSFFFTKDSFYYGRVRRGNETIVIGPAFQVSYSPSKLREILFRLGVSNNDIPEFVQSLSSRSSFPLTARIRTLLMVNYIWNDEELSPSSVIIQGEEQSQIKENRAKETEQEENIYPHNTYQREQKMLSYVKEGDLPALNRLFESERPVRTGTIAQTPIRQRKNRFVVSVTLVSRACIQGGRTIQEALSLSDNYLQQRERMNSAESIQNLTYHRIMDYSEKRSSISGKDQYSKSTREAIRIIQQNVNQRISIDDIADKVYLSKNRLEVKFKQETGKTLHDFILERKRKEAKNLLRNTSQTIQEISDYLCFSSQSYFQNVFKKEFHITPNQYRSGKEK